VQICGKNGEMSGTEFYHALWPLAEANEAAGIE
jgi:hypothetical protein